jgi:signal transduction histidine kinase
MPADGAPPVWWVYLLAGLVIVVFTGAVIGVFIVAQRRQIAQAHRFAQGLVDAQEAERARIARELHDDIIQRIALLGGELSGLSRTIPNPSGAVAQRMEGLREELHDLADEVRQIARRAHPAVLDHLGLVKALQLLAGEMAVSDDLEVDVVIEQADRFEALAPAVALTFYRVAQEALRNVARHARTPRATVQLGSRDQGVFIAVRDRGAGMDPGDRNGRGLGLLGIGERLRAVHGHLEIDSAPGRGTELTAWIPWNGAAG